MVSVIVPLFNKFEYVGKTLESVVKQTYPRIELIVVDDGSTDESLVRVKEFVATHQRDFEKVKVVSQKNSGQTSSRIFGVSLSQGEFLAFLDADDVWHPEKISRQVQAFNQQPDLDLVLCDYSILNGTSRLVRTVKLNNLEKRIVAWLLTFGFGCLPESTGLIKRKSYEKIDGFNPKLEMCAGLDLVFRLSILGNVIAIPNVLCGYRVLATGWHNNKVDLLSSYRLMLNSHPVYRRIADEALLYLNLYMVIHALRQNKTRAHLFIFAALFKQIPRITSVYIFKSVWRNMVSIMPSWNNHKYIQDIRNVASL